MLAASVIVGGCFGGGKELVKFTLVSKAPNQDDKGEPLPVVIRIYQLAGKDKLEKASFKSLWKNDKEVLENDLLDRKEVTIYPDSETPLDLEVDTKKGAQYLGVMGLFRNPQGDTWRLVVPVKGGFFKQSIRLIVDKQTLRLAGKKE